MKTLDSVLDKFEGFMCTVLASVMAVSILVQVINRNTVQASLPWCEELARYCMVWLTMIGISAGVKKGSHIGVDAVVNAMPAGVQRFIRILSSCFVTFMYVVLAILSIMITVGIKETGQVSAAMQVPMYLIYAAMIVGFFMSALRSLMKNIELIKGAPSTDDENPMAEF